MLITSHRPSRTNDIMVPLPRLLSAQYTAKLALDEETQDAMYRLRYRAYLAQGYIAADPSERFSDEYDTLPNTKSILLYSDGKPIASVRTCSLSLGSRQRSAAADLYPEKVKELLRTAQPDAGSNGFAHRGIEFNRLVRSPECDNNQGLVLLLYRMAGYIAMTMHAQMIFACVRSHHLAFYKKLGLQPAAPPRPYPGLRCNMELLYCTRAAFDRMRFAYPVVDAFTAATGPLDGFMAGAPVSLFVTEP